VRCAAELDSGAAAPYSYAVSAIPERDPIPPERGVGEALRAARTARGYSLSQVAEATGISKSSLSLIENDRSDVSLGRLLRLADFYDVRLTDLVPHSGRSDPIVIRRRERPHLYSQPEGLDVYVLTDQRGLRMLPAVGVFAPGGGAAEFASHAGEEFMLVLEGTVLLELDGSEPITLERGDSAYYRSDRPHRWSNLGDGIARIVAVASPPHW
jgi:transcriptional regulator with XRE-family HTH domain